MRNLLYISLLSSSLLFGDLIEKFPIDKEFLSIDNGGNKSAIDAYSDGIGFITNSKVLLNNNALNILVFKYGKEAKNSGDTLKKYINNNITNDEDLKLANNLGNIFTDIIPDGTTCNDNNSETINDIYISKLCVGTNVEGQVCNDNNIQTINDKYSNGICSGENIEGLSCNDNNSETYNDKYISGICMGTSLLSSLNLISLPYNGYSSGTLTPSTPIYLSQHVSGQVDGVISDISVGNNSLYFEFVQNGFAQAVAINGQSYKWLTGSLWFYMTEGTRISVFYNPNTNKASICNNGTLCKSYVVSSNTLKLFFGSGTLTSGPISLVDPASHNNTYKQAAYNATL